MRMNFYNHHNSVSFKSHSIRVTFKICVVLGAQGIRATGFRRAQGNQHCAKFESRHLKLMLLALHEVFTPINMLNSNLSS